MSATGTCTPFSLLAFDTVGGTTPIDVDVPKTVTASLRPLKNCMRHDRVPVLLVHHAAKQASGTGAAVSSLGTTAMPAAVDVILNLQRVGPDPADTRRRLVVTSRYAPRAFEVFYRMDDADRLERYDPAGERSPAPASAKRSARRGKTPPPSQNVPVCPPMPKGKGT